jgi:hypothetical protein
MTPRSGQVPHAARWRLVIRILVTMALGGGTYLLGNVVHQAPAQSLMLSVFVGGVVLVLQLLIEFETRVTALEVGQDRLAAEVRSVVAQTFSAVSEATELFGRVEASALRDDVVRTARSALRIGRPAPLLVDLARAQLERTSHLLEQVGGSSEVSYDGEDRDWLLSLTYHVKSTLDATSRGSFGPDGRFVDEGLWRTELGRRYLEMQARALRNGVTIRRVFILDGAELLGDPDFREICDEQRDLGILVRAVVLQKVRSAGVSFVADFILFDDAVSYESTLLRPRTGQGQPMYVATTLVLDRVRIGQQRQRFDELWASPDELGPAG